MKTFLNANIKVQKLLDYIWNVWLFRNFGIELWNISERSVHFRTTNRSENWYSVFKKVVGSAKPNSYKMLIKLVKKQDRARLELARLKTGAPDVKQRKEFANFNTRVLQMKFLYLDVKISLDQFWNKMAEICYKTVQFHMKL